MVEELRSAGWRVLTIWECSLKGKEKLGLEAVVAKIVDWLACGGVAEDIPAKGG